MHRGIPHHLMAKDGEGVIAMPLVPAHPEDERFKVILDQGEFKASMGYLRSCLKILKEAGRRIGKELKSSLVCPGSG